MLAFLFLRTRLEWIRDAALCLACVSGCRCSDHDPRVMQVFLKSMDDFKPVNAIYAEFFGDHKPARSAVEVARLPLDALFEIEAIVQ